MKKAILWAVGCLTGVAIFLGGIGVSYASQFFEFNKESIMHMGYADNLWMIQNSPGEFWTEDIIWMIDNDCLDMAGATWCVSAGLIPEEALGRPALSEEKTKPQTIFGGDGNGTTIDKPEEEPEQGTEEQTEEIPSTQAPEEEPEQLPEQKPERPEEEPEQETERPRKEQADKDDGRKQEDFVKSPERVDEEVTGETLETQPGKKTEPSKSKQVEEPVVSETEEDAAYGHFYDELDNEAKAAYSYFKARGENPFIQVASTASMRTIEGRYLKSQTPNTGEIQFATENGKILYTFIFSNPVLEDEKVIDLSLDLSKKDSGSDTVEEYDLTLGSVYPEGVSVKVLMDRINQTYTVTDKSGKKVGTYKSDYSGYLEMPVKQDTYTITCDVSISKETEPEKVQETEMEKTPEEEVKKKETPIIMVVLYAVIGAVVLFSGIALVYRARKKAHWN